jgi:hypothetical protein
MDSSYEVLGHDSNSEGTMSGEEMEEEVNGEEVREQMEGFMTSQIIRTAVAGIVIWLAYYTSGQDRQISVSLWLSWPPSACVFLIGSGTLFLHSNLC